MIEIHGLTKRYGETIAVDRLSLEVAKGELMVLLGGSGSGKTTTLKMVNRLIQPTAGRVLIEGLDTAAVDGPALRRRIGYAFQRIGLFPHLSVAENVGITPELLGWPASRIAARVDELLDLVELPPAAYRHRLPNELSGGQQQRVGVARALAAEPSIVLFDEPFGALDPLTRDRLQRSFDEIRRRLSVTGLFVTHDVTEALLLADRIAVLHEGRLIQCGTPRELVQSPGHDVVRQLLATPLRQARAVDELLGATDG